MKKDGNIIVDSHGYIRVPENIRFRDIHKIADMLFQCSGKDIGIQKLDEDFDTYDRKSGKLKPKGGGERWTREQEQFYLENADLDNASLAQKMNERFSTNRSGMSIKMKYDAIVRPFDSWCDDHASELEGIDRNGRIRRYMEEDVPRGKDE